MSEAVTLTSGATGTVYGSLAAGLIVLDTRLGEEYAAYSALDANTRKRAQLNVRYFLDTFDWADDYATFDARDALQADATLPGDEGYPFRVASYLLAALAAFDASVVSVAQDDQQVTSVSIAGASLSLTAGSRFGDPKSRLPPDVLALLSPYFNQSNATAAATALGGRGQEGSDCNPFSTLRSGRREPW